MKTSLSTLALLAMAAAPAVAVRAETTLYGSARVGIAYTERDRSPTGASIDDGGFWDVRDEGGSRLGVRGAEDLGGGLSAIYQYEFGVNIDGKADGNPFNQRLSWVGFKGGFGQVTVGRQWTVYNNSVAFDGVWNSDDTTSTFYQLGGPYRVSNMIMYTTPNLSGFSASGAVVIDGAGSHDSANDSLSTKDGIDMYDIGATYTNGPLRLGAAYRKYEGRVLGDAGQNFYGAGDSLWGVAAAYKFGGVFNLIGVYQQAETDLRVEGASPRAYSLTGEYSFGANTLRAAVGRMDLDKLAASYGREDENQDIWKVGYQYDFSKRTRVWVEYGDYDFSSFSNNANGFQQGFDYSNLSIGMRHDF